MKNLLVILTSLACCGVYGNDIIRNDTIEHKNSNGTTKLYHGTQAYQFSTDLDSFNFNKKVLINGIAIGAETPMSITVPDGGNYTVIVGNITTNKVVRIKYSAFRGSLYETGVIEVTNTADTRIYITSRFDLTIDSSPPSTDTITKSISGNDIRITFKDNLSDGNDTEITLTLEHEPL